MTIRGSRELLRLALRRDRLMLPVWLYAIAGSTLATLVAFQRLYATDADRTRFALSINASSSLRALYGSVFDPTSIGGLTAWRMLVAGAVLTGLMSQLLVVRHSRAEEESGRLELVGAGVVGRGAALTAAVTTAALANLAIALVVGAGLTALGQPAAGSFALGLAFAGVGLCFAGVAAVTAQFTETARGANVLTGVLLGAAFLTRAAGDGAGPDGARRLSWLSPIGWAEQIRPYGGDRWWPLALLLTVAALLLGWAAALGNRRDLGAALLAPKPGPAAAGPRLRSTRALAWRLERGALLGWVLGFTTGGLVVGGVSNGVLDMIRGSDQLRQIIERMGGQQRAVDAYLAAILGVFGMVASVYAVQAVLRMRAEESSGRAEPLLATPVSRLRWAGGHLVHPVLGSAVLLAAGGAATGIGAGAAVGDPVGRLGRCLVAALVQLPVVWVMTGFAVAVVGLLPRREPAVWGVSALVLLIGYLGPALDLNHWIMDLTPFQHLPRLPGGSLQWAPLLWLTLLATGLAGTGLAGLRRRDVG
ncbi:ABC transporter permease [Kitasatospora sp. NPDC093102]|uniref:ABC transporter permease n=1 Tax=Kitasatospora sp. NPDC093102 TaxID=3155069 RepID=UPI0034319D45